jgi:hypothetical protein
MEHQAVYPRGQPTPQLAVESCSLAILALRIHRPPEYIQALHALVAAQNRDGSWPAFIGDDTQGCWVTALAVLALIAVRQTRADLVGGIRWLLDAKGREANWFWRWKFQTVDNSVKFDPRKYGWSWMPGTTSWVIPTAFSLIALQQVRDAGLSLHARLSERVTVGISMLLDRMCLGGGWNAGNGIVFGMAFAPYIDATAIALLALQGHKNNAVNPSLSWLSARLGVCPSPYSLAWGIVALAAYHEEGERRHALFDASNALIAAIEKGGSALDTATLAICALALEAVDGPNVFAVRT